MVAVIWSVTGSAVADVQYDTSGEDVYRIQSADAFSKVSYVGTERLAVRPEGKAWRFEVRARYTRDGPDGKDREEALFVQILRRDGTFEDRIDNDPDFLTVLNQPFAVRLDPATLRDLRRLHGPVPFSATSPLGAEAVLRGFLRPATGGAIDGRQTVAVRFEANGAMTGPLPSYSGMLVSGTLLGLNVALTLKARLAQSRSSVAIPVQIVYRRTMRASAKTRPPVPLATGGETAAPATP